VAAAIGVRATLVGAAIVGGVVTFGALFIPGMRDIEGGSALQLRERVLPLRDATAPRPR